MVSESVLKPCPFCGSEAYIAETWDITTKYVQCTLCGCRTRSSKNRLEVIDLWNRRVPPSKAGQKKKSITVP